MIWVVDTNVARSASDQSPDALAVRCADALLAIDRRGADQVGFNTALWSEWQAAPSRFQARWQADLAAQGRLVVLPDDPDPALRSAVAALPQNDRVPAGKDLHLVEAGLHASQRILSHEKQSRARFARCVPQVPALADLHWVSPAAAGCLAWIEGGAPQEPAYGLTTPPCW